MESEIYHQINVIDCECSINSIEYDATDLKIMLDRFDGRGTITILFRNVFAYRVTLEHFRMTEVMVGLTSSPLYEVENSSYLGEIMATGMSALYGSSLKRKALCNKGNRTHRRYFNIRSLHHRLKLTDNRFWLCESYKGITD